MITVSPRGLMALVFGSLATLSMAAGLPPQYAGTPTVKEYPAADVLVLSQSRAFTLLSDGRVVESVKRVEKVLTYQGMDEMGDPKIAFNKDNQDLAIARCRTYTPDGRMVDAKANSFNEMTPFALEKAPAYTPWRQMVVTKVGLDVNAVVELEYTITDKKPWRRFLEGVEILRERDPALVQEVSVTVPEGMDLHGKLLNAEAKPEARTANGQATTTWTLRDVPAVNVMGTARAEWSFLPTLIFTTAPGWGHQAAIVGGLVQKAIETSSPALDKKAGDLLAGIQDPFEKAVKLQNYVAEFINTVAWPLADFDFVPRSAAEVYDSGYGHGLDKAVLLCAMLKKAGIDAAIAAVRMVPEGMEDPTDVPCLGQMTGALVRAQVGKSVLWMDPDAPLSERSQRDFQGYKGLPLVMGSGEIHTMVPLDAPDASSVTLDAKVAQDLSLEGKGTVSLSGGYSPFFNVQGSKEAQKAFLGGLVESVLPGAALSDFSVVRMDPARAVFNVSFKAPAPEKGTVKSLKTGLPDGSVLKGVHGEFLEVRELPLVLSHGGSERIDLKLTLAEGLKPAYLPKAIAEHGAAGSLTQAWSAADGAVTLSFEASIPKPVIAAKDYPSFRALQGMASAQTARTVIFE